MASSLDAPSPSPPLTNSPSPPPVGLAEEYKMKGNEFFKQNKYSQAIEWYSRAMEENPKEPVYVANRAFCHLRLEEYGTAVEDASLAISLNPKYVKAYYRRGDAYMALGKYKLAKADLKRVTELLPKDKNAQLKLNECVRAIRLQLFSEAIAGENSKPPSERVDLSAMTVDSSYSGPTFTAPITLQFVLELIEHFKNDKRLHARFVYEIVLLAIKLFHALPTLVDIERPAEGKIFTVCGDVHGQFYDLLNIFKLNGMPSEDNPYLFNGDFVDRGSFSYEVIMTLLCFKLLYPNHFHMTRGNHETRNMNTMYGFQGEVKEKVDAKAYDLFEELFCCLPLAARIGEKVLVVHGGLFGKDGVTLDDIRKIDRFRQPPEDGIMSEILWSDPMPMNGRQPSKRGVALSFGPDVTSRFLNENALETLIRSHEVKDDGYEIAHGGRCLTVFSAPNYCDQMGNKGAFVRLNASLKPDFVQFAAVPHPKVSAMKYAMPFFSMMS